MGYKENKAKYEPIARKFATLHGIDPNLFAAQIEQESGWNPKAGSSAGAQGIAQIIPSTAKSWGLQDVWNPEQALNSAAKNMANYVKTYQNNKILNPSGDYLTAHKLALAAYNAGAGAVQKYKGIPKYKETQDYVSRISKAFKGQNPLSGSDQKLKLDGMGQNLSLDKAGQKLNLNTTPKQIPQQSPNQYNNQTKSPQQFSNQNSGNPLPNGQKSLYAVDQLANIEKSIMNRGTGNMSGQYPDPNSMYQKQRSTVKDPDLLGVNAQNNYNTKMSRLESALTGRPSSYSSSYIDSDDRSEKQNNLFNNAIQSINNTWGSPASKFNVPAFRSRRVKTFQSEPDVEFA